MDTAPWHFVALALLAVLAVQTAWIVLRRWLRRRAILARLARAGEGEARAAAWLEDLGFAIVASQATTEYTLEVDGEPVTATVRADYLVERDGARFVAEVKTGALAPRVETAATRRQLLEYRVAFDADGVLLVDAEAGRVHAVSFPGVGERRRGARWWLVGLAAGAVVAAALALALRG